MAYPRTLSHIGISVTDLEKAVKFYTEVFGWYVIMPPTEIVSDDSAIGVMCDDVFGEGWEKFKTGWADPDCKLGHQTLYNVCYLCILSWDLVSYFHWA